MKNFHDAPIAKPSDDCLGFDPFAKAIADCIQELTKPEGSVVSIYGPWGSGKSSVINLVRHHLENANELEDENKLKIINFPAWMYSSEDAMTVGFFRELYAGLSSVLPKKNKAVNALRKLGANLAGASKLTGMGVGLFTGSLGEKAATATLDAIGKFIEQEDSIEDLQSQLANALDAGKQRFLVVVDDLDRLSPEEALVLFRLIKSVGRLPNVMYLLAYDRLAMDAAVAERFPSEGPHYLEKIVQAGFEIPEPDQSQLNVVVSEFLSEFVHKIPQTEWPEYRNLFLTVVAPELKTPRDVLRLANALPVTSTPVINDVFLPDFICLETLRIFRPKVYQAIRIRKSEILNADKIGPNDQRDERSAFFTSLLLDAEPKAEHERLKEGLMKLFPQLSLVFDNIEHDDTFERARKRRVSSPQHFDTYFRFAISPRTVPRKDIDFILDPKRTPDEIQEKFLQAIRTFRGDGRSEASYLLDELNAHGETATPLQAENVLTALFEITDELFSENDRERGLGFVDNRLRLHWLLRNLLKHNTSLQDRSTILMRCIGTASLSWLLEFSRSACEDHFLGDSKRPRSKEEDTLLTVDDARGLRRVAYRAMIQAASSNKLFDLVDPASVLFEWYKFNPEKPSKVRQFTATALNDDQTVVTLTKALLGKCYAHEIDGIGGISGDLVSREKDHAKVEGLECILDVGSFRARLEQLVDNSDLDDQGREIIRRFLAAWRDQEIAKVQALRRG